MSEPRAKYTVRSLQDVFRLPPELVPAFCDQLREGVRLWQRDGNAEANGLPVEVVFVPDGKVWAVLNVVDQQRRVMS